MECVDSNANTYIEKLDKLVLSMIDDDSDTESLCSDDEMTDSDESDTNGPDTSDKNDPDESDELDRNSETDSEQDNESEDQHVTPYEMRF